MAGQKHFLRVLDFPKPLEVEMNIAAVKKFPGQKDGRRAWLIEAIREKLEREGQAETTSKRG